MNKRDAEGRKSEGCLKAATIAYLAGNNTKRYNYTHGGTMEAQNLSILNYPISRILFSYAQITKEISNVKWAVLQPSLIL